MSGPIPADLGNLSNLEVLRLGVNQLSGPIPVDLGSLSALEVLRLGVNQLSGPIPAELGQPLHTCKRLQEIHLFDNQLGGEIPAELGSLSRLQRLTLSRNQLGGGIPAELGRLSNLAFLSLSGNQLSGEIPEEFGTLSKLRWLWLSDNRLTGPIPIELGRLSNLEQLDLSGNQLTGCIPEGLRDVGDNDSYDLGLPFCTPAQSGHSDRAALIALYNAVGGPGWTRNNNWLSDAPIGNWFGVTTDSTGRVSILDLMENQLTGEIPAELDGLSDLQMLTLSGNQLSGCIPARLSAVGQNDLSELGLPYCTPVESNELDVAALTAFYNATGGPTWADSSNWLITRPIGSWFGVATDDAGRVTRLERIGNELSGRIPPELGSLSKLEELRLWDNRLNGEIPEELGHLSNLEYLALHDNQLSGKIPEKLRRLSNLRWLVLSNNQLSGEIPEELGRLSDLRVLHISENQLSGGIPAELGNLSNLEELVLSGNQLSGEIPAERDNLEELVLSNNQLSGAIPAELGGLSNLEELVLSNNQLSGEIPGELGALSSLRVLHLSGNQLTGCIPETLRYVEENDLSDLGLPFCTSTPTASPSDDSGRDGRLEVSHKQLSGEIPGEFGTLSNRPVLYLSGNQLSGCTPEGLRDVENNGQSDVVLPVCASTVASKSSDDSDRAALIAFYNAADGPNWWKNDNWLSSAPIGEWYGVTTGDTGRVTKLELSYNQLSGEIPAELGVFERGDTSGVG